MRDQPAPTELAPFLAALDGPRDRSALEYLKGFFAPRPGLSYAPDVIERRSRIRLAHAFRAVEEHGGGKANVVLDVGCARAENAPYVADLGGIHYIGLDVDDTHFPEAVSLGNRARLIKASAEDIPLPDSSVDLGISFNVFEHIPSPAAALSEIVRVLRPGGVFFTKFGPPFNSQSGPHLTRYLDLPFMQHLFAEEVVASFVGRRNAYHSVNRHPLSYYRSEFFAERGFQLVRYREQIDPRAIEFIPWLPEITRRFPLDELAVCSITAVVQKKASILRHP